MRLRSIGCITVKAGSWRWIRLRINLVDELNRNHLDEWQKQHAGKLIDTISYVWECEDTCGCSQAVTEEIYENKIAGSKWIIRVRIWEGSYFTDWNPGADKELI